MELVAGLDIEHRLHRAWRKQRRLAHTRGLCYVLLWLVALVALDLLLDWLFLLPGEARVALLIVNAGALGWVAWRRWWRRLEPFNEVTAALQVERRHPELQSLLVSYVQLREDDLPPQASPALVRALRREAVEMSRPMDFREIVSFAELKRIAIFALTCFLLFGAYSVNWSGHLRVLIQRMLNPESDVGYPTRTQIVEVTGGVTVQQGQPVTIAAQAGGRIPESGTLYVKPGEGPWERLVFPQGKPGQFSYRFAEVLDSFRYRVRLGDARSAYYDVTVVPPPRIVKTRITLKCPDYTGLRPPPLNRLNFEAPEGTQIDWEMTSDAPLTRAMMLLDDGQQVELKPDPTGRVLRHTVTATESFSYRFTWHERGHGYVYEDDVRYFVHVIPDLPPRVELFYPTEDDKATTRKTLTIRYHAADDYGLANAWIVYALEDGSEKRFPIEGFDPTPGRKEIAWKLRDKIPGITEGDVLTYAIEVSDRYTAPGGRPPSRSPRPAPAAKAPGPSPERVTVSDRGPHRTRSQPRRLYIVSIEEYRRHILERRKKLRAELEALRGQEQEADTEVDTLIKEHDEPPREQDGPADPQPDAPKAPPPRK